jgi:DNA adenine methylase
MKYMGSKARHAKEILSIVLKDRTPDQTYVEPFVGGCNTIDKVRGKRIGSDINEYLIELWKALQHGWLPPEYITKEQYIEIRENKHTCSKELLAWVGHCCSYNGKWFGGFAGEIITKEGTTRNYQHEAKRAILKQVNQLQGVEFSFCSYHELTIPEGSVVYCDPPYKGTTGYKDKFDHEPFYNWCRELKTKGCSVFVSEYGMPEDFTEVWSKEVNSSLTQDTGSKKNTEKLFTLL